MSRKKKRKLRSAAQGHEAHIRPALGPRPALAYPTRLDAVVLAGTDRNPRRLIAGRNKALLDLGGRTLIRRVVEGLLAASNIDRVFVVGPVDALQAELGDLSRVRLVEQVGQMLRNAWTGWTASRSLRAAGGAPPHPVLFLSCDLPLLTPEAVDDFVARCAQEDRGRADHPYALMVGVVEEDAVLPFYPAPGKPGIIRPFVELRSGRVRLANIYVARPEGLSHRELLETGFSYRKAKDWRNVLGLAWSLFGRRGGWRAAWLILRLQLTLMSARRKGRIYRWMRRRNTAEEIERAASLLLGGPLRLVTTPYGGLSLDVDDDEDYLILGQRFREWRAVGDGIRGARPA